MKALSIKQPWVHAILHGGKDIENRSWKTDFRGWIAIHASGAPDRYAELPRRRMQGMVINELDRSAICGVARIANIVTESRSPWFQVPENGSVNYGWVLKDAIALPSPIPCTGWLKLWEVPSGIVRRIRRQLPHIQLPE